MVAVLLMFVFSVVVLPRMTVFLSAVPGWDLVIGDRHAKEGLRHLLDRKKRPGPMVGRPIEPHPFMEDVISPTVEKIIVRHSRGIRHCRPWDHDELGWCRDYNRGWWRWWGPKVDTDINLRHYQYW
jgi:hypothetical protein